MKTLKQYFLAAMFLLVFAPVQLNAAEANDITSVNTSILVKDANEKATMQRLKAIKALAKTNLTKNEQRDLRNEVLAIRDQQRGQGGVVYI